MDVTPVTSTELHALLLTRKELNAGGWTERRITGAVRSGGLVRVRRDGYVLGEHWRDLDVRAMHAAQVDAGTRRIQRRTFASHESALVLAGVRLMRQPVAPVLTAIGGKPKSYPDLTVQVAQVPDEHRTVIAGVDSVTPARGVVDVARNGTFMSGLIAADSALHLKVCSARDLRHAVAACTGWPGVRNARLVAHLADGRAESPGESISRALFYEYGLEPPDLQVWIATERGGPPDYRVDFLWRSYRTIGEFDGRSKYVPDDDDPEAARRLGQVIWAEKKRQERLEDAGWRVIRWGWDDVIFRGHELISRIRRCFDEALLRAS